MYGFIVPLSDCGEKYDVWFSRFLLGKDAGFKLSMSRKPVVKRIWFKGNKVLFIRFFSFQFIEFFLESQLLYGDHFEFFERHEFKTS